VPCRLPQVEHSLRLVSGDIDAQLFQSIDGERIKDARVQSSAMSFKIISTHFVQQCGCDLTSRTVLNTNKEDFFFHCLANACFGVRKIAAGSQQASRKSPSFAKSRLKVASD
jgi:hypothetical protein